MSIASQINRIANACDAQTVLIQQIKEELQGKTACDADPVIEPLKVTENGTYTAPNGVDGYSPVVVNVPIPDGYIIPSGTLEVTENGKHDVTEYAFVDVNVPTGGGGDTPTTGVCPSLTITIASGVVLENVIYFSNKQMLMDASYNNMKSVILENVDIGEYVVVTASTMNSGDMKIDDFANIEFCCTNPHNCVFKCISTEPASVTISEDFVLPWG